MKISTLCLKLIENSKYVYIAYSGGLDSHVLLHLCSEQQTIRAKLTAVYVHHGLQKEADSWSIHCQQQAEQLGVNFKVLHVNAKSSSQQSPEEAARDARYQALKQLLNSNDVLLVAQHREDQLETVLLQLFRGAGVQGLSAMPETSISGQGQLLRPLLDCSQQSLKDYAVQWQLNWVEDPSNQCDDFERNFLRNQIIPQLKTHWQALDKTVARTAKHCANAQQLLTELAIDLLAKPMNADHSLSIEVLLSLENHQRALVIRQWFAHFNLKMPSVRFIDQLFNQVIAAKNDANPILERHDCKIRRYQNKLYCLMADNAILKPLCWSQKNEKLSLSPSSYLQCIRAETGILQDLWQTSIITIRYRSGGEKIALPNRKGHHSLKHLFQEAKIPPWERHQIPLIYMNDKLIAVADLWISSAILTTVTDKSCYQFRWSR
jgi:tRNA(Ile)-lysidine synthase